MAEPTTEVTEFVLVGWKNTVTLMPENKCLLIMLGYEMFVISAVAASQRWAS